MHHLPDPSTYKDPIRYFRDSHGVIKEALQDLEHLLAAVPADGLEQSLETQGSQWDEVFTFFLRSGPRHEKEEEDALFPVMHSKLKSIGFRVAEDPAKFLSAEHFEMRRLTRNLRDIGNQIRQVGTASVEQIAEFQRVGAQLVSVYKQHIAKENEIIYKLANEELLTPDERENVMESILILNSPQSMTSMLTYEQSEFSDVSKSGIDTSYLGENAEETDETE